MKSVPEQPHPCALAGQVRAVLFLLRFCFLLLCAAPLPVRAAIQFDVFLGYDGIVPQACWFPVVCEIKNDGPSFSGMVDLSGDQFNQSQSIKLAVELPTGTLKRVVLPVFSSTMNARWNVRLLDERGKVRSEQTGLQARKHPGPGTPVLGALARTPSGAPVIKPVMSQSEEIQPATARLLPSIFPDNPLVLEGLTALYLNSERAVDLSVNQVNALLAWLRAGGHLILGIEQPSDVTSSPWLKGLVPCEPKDLHAVARHPELQTWLTSDTWRTNIIRQPGPPMPVYQGNAQRRYRLNMPPSTPEEAVDTNPFRSLPLDFDFEGAPLQVAVGPMRETNIVVAAGDTPLIITAERGRGRITVLLFSPEREPVRSWKNLDTFWAKLADVPGNWYASKEYNPRGGWSTDGIFGAMIDSRQVHKLPVGWLLLLLTVYLVVIGPFDQFWLKRIGRPMLTWITFPCYVVLFSLLIYFIGYKLRAGESEWNELHVVDVLPAGDHAELRGRTYTSVYSPVNQRYALDSQQKYAAFRGEFAGLWESSSEKATIIQNGDSFKAEVFVPVWASELYVSDWWQPESVPLTFSATGQGNAWEVRVENRTERKLSNLQVVLEGRISSLGEVPAQQSKTFKVSREQGIPLQGFVTTEGARFGEAVNSRKHALGSTSAGQISDLPAASVAACFIEQLKGQAAYGASFISPPGLDLSPIVERGRDAILLAWAPDYSPVKPMYHFSPRRSQRNTLWRITAPIQ